MKTMSLASKYWPIGKREDLDPAKIHVVLVADLNSPTCIHIFSND